MKIATFNINGVKARLPRLLEWLDETKPDVACLQEIKSQDEGFPGDAFPAVGYQAIWHGQKGFNGVALLVRDGLDVVLRRKGLPGDDSDEQARYIEAEIAGHIIASIYLPNGNPQPGPKFDYKLAWMERLRLHAASLLTEEKPVILAGDYNVIPTDADIQDPRAMRDDALMQPESRAAFRSIVHQGWCDAVRQIHPEGHVWTFWDYQAGAWPRDAGFRIDHLLLSPQAADRLTNAGVDRATRGKEKASDHAPTWCILSDMADAG